MRIVYQLGAPYPGSPRTFYIQFLCIRTGFMFIRQGSRLDRLFTKILGQPVY